MKKILNLKPIIFLIIGFLCVCISVTYALFANGYIYSNMFKTSAHDVILEENFEEVPWRENIPTTKEVYVVNQGDGDVVVRISYEEVWSRLEGENLFQISNIVDGKNVVTKNWTESFLKDWILNEEDGYYYYKKILKGNSRVQILESILLNYDLIKFSDEDYLLHDYELIFNFEAVQASEKAIEKVWGMEAKIEDDNVYI